MNEKQEALGALPLPLRERVVGGADRVRGRANPSIERRPPREIERFEQPLIRHASHDTFSGKGEG